MEMEELRKAKRRGTGMKRVRRMEKTKEEAQLTLSGKKYALTTRLWLPDTELEYDEASDDPKQVLLGEYINALPAGDQESIRLSQWSEWYVQTSCCL
jgi:hypothetical protein